VWGSAARVAISQWVLSSLENGSILAGYRIEEVVARGGMGVVYRATQLALDRSVALKVIAPEIAQDREFRDRFQRESRLAASIDHPNVIPVHEAGEAQGMLYITMRLVDGIDLGRMVNRLGPFDRERAVRIVAQVASALDAAHARGLVHRDVKPANTLVTGTDHVYLTDFGLTKQIGSDSALTQTGQVLGTVNYSAPEQIGGGDVDARTDVYALACVAFQVLTARLPFERDTPVAMLWAHTNDPPPALRDFDPQLGAADDVLKRGLAKSPDDRFQSAGDFGRALEAALSGSAPPPPERIVAIGDAAPDDATVARREQTSPTRQFVGHGTPTNVAQMPPTTVQPGRRRRWLVPLVLGLLAVAAVTAAVVLLGGGGSVDEPGDALSAKTLSVTPIRVGGTPSGVAVGAGGVWITDNAGGTVRKLNARTGAPEGDPIRVGESPRSVVTGEGFVWVVSSGENNQLTRVDPDSGEVSGQPIDVGFNAGEVTTGDGAVWVADAGEDRVLRIDPRSNRVVARIDVQAGVGGDIAVGSGFVWVAGKSAEPALSQIETSNNRVVPGEGDFDGDIAVGEGFGWSYNPGGFVARIDPKTKLERGRAALEDSAGGEVEVGAGAVWALDEANGRLWRIDPRTGRVRGSATQVQAEPDSGLAIGPDAAWVTQPSSDTVVRIGF